MSGHVLAMRRPPIRKLVVVRSDPQHAFDVYARRIGEWWPLVPFSRGGERVVEVRVDERVGGTVAEVWDDGTSCAWGDVLAWEPGARFAMSWNITGTPTEVELDFTALGPAVTRVRLEHRGWERLTEAELGADCALPGGYLGGSFDRGWDAILQRYVVAAGGAAR